MSEHNPNAWQDGFDAWQNGYDDAMYDGIDTSSEMPCKCEACLKAYDEGQQEAIKEIFGRGQSAQQTLAPDACPYCLGKGEEPANKVMVRCRFCGGTGKRG